MISQLSDQLRELIEMNRELREENNYLRKVYQSNLWISVIYIIHIMLSLVDPDSSTQPETSPPVFPAPATYRTHKDQKEVLHPCPG